MDSNESATTNTLYYELYFLENRGALLSDCRKQELEVKLSDDNPTLLFGSNHFDHRVEDEWHVIYKLYHLSSITPDLVVRVYDDDGSILLIEAADHLPSWLESKCKYSERRAFVFQKRLHIIPQSIIVDKNTSLNDCAKLIRSKKLKTAASSSIQLAIKNKLKGLPDKDNWTQLQIKMMETDKSDKKTKLTLEAIVAMNEDDLEVMTDSSDD